MLWIVPHDGEGSECSDCSDASFFLKAEAGSACTTWLSHPSTHMGAFRTSPHGSSGGARAIPALSLARMLRMFHVPTPS